MKKVLLITALFLLTNSVLCTLTIHVAPIKYQAAGKADAPPDIRELLVTKLSSYFRWENLFFKALENTGDAPASFTDAMRLCNKYSLDYLLYGYIEENDSSLYCEIKLFDGRNQEILQAFYSGDSRGKILRLVDDIAGKIALYFNEELKMAVSDTVAVLPTEGIISIALGGGYWVPLPVWYTYILPLYSACLDIRFIPWRPAEGEGLRDFYFRMGLHVNFLHSVNQPGYEAMQLFAFTFGIPAYLCLDIGTRHTIALGAAPEFAFDYLVRDKFHDAQIRTLALLFSGSADLEYQFRFTRNFSMSVNNRVAMQFMKSPRLSYNMNLSFEFYLDPIVENRTGVKHNEK